MNKYVEEKRYRGKVQALILDWSGTTADAYVVLHPAWHKAANKINKKTIEVFKILHFKLSNN